MPGRFRPRRKRGRRCSARLYGSAFNVTRHRTTDTRARSLAVRPHHPQAWRARAPPTRAADFHRLAAWHAVPVSREHRRFAQMRLANDADHRTFTFVSRYAPRSRLPERTQSPEGHCLPKNYLFGLPHRKNRLTRGRSGRSRRLPSLIRPSFSCLPGDLHRESRY